jgi:cell division protein FtsB
MKKIAYIFVVIGLCLVINSLIHSIYDLWHKQDLLTAVQKELVLEQEKGKKLKKDYEYAQTQNFIEEQARDKLFMVKGGEQQVLITQTSPRDKSKAKNIFPNWQQWINLFF